MACNIFWPNETQIVNYPEQERIRGTGIPDGSSGVHVPSTTIAQQNFKLLEV